ncbi:hypothetical protein GOP47_0006768 [Adiantum capillus-veneris]|uniref:Pentatricopeptide repeat-containing protein n=1 Tax=Adiantum capillus-veneris TaxID=13818 RepID=A0A9D4V492_ADICA|nr:hypothetical protein GOP47_0006768 [Adiantum capillus-veneris]
MRRETLNLKNAICFLKQAHELPSLQNLLIILQQCRREKDAEIAKSLHSLLCKCGLEVHAILGNHLVRVFVESDELPTAELVFERLLDRNEDSWTSFMHGCIDHGHPIHALHLHQQMQTEGFPCASIALLQTLLKACANLKDAIPGQTFHFEVVKLGFETDPFVGSALVDMYAKSGSISSAFDVFDRLQDRDVVLWTTIIAGFIEHGLVDDGFKSVDTMQTEGVSPNAVTFSCVLKGCGSKTCLSRLHQVHTQVVKQGFEKEVCIDTTLVNVYAKCGSFTEAHKIFQGLFARDVILWTALVTAYADQGCEAGTLDCLDQMEKEGVSPNAVTYMCTLKAFNDIKSSDGIHKIHLQLIIRGLENSPSVGGTLVFTYGRCGLLEDAQAVVDGLPVQDIFSCNSLLLAFTEQGLDYNALDCVEKMQVEGVSSNAFTFVCILKACGRQRLIEKGLWIHAEIAKEEFDEDPYISCSLVDMYSKCGFFSEAWAVVEQLSAQNTATWTALIAGYVEHGHFKEALNCLRRMQDKDMALDDVTFVCGLKACAGSGALEAGQCLHAELTKDGHEIEPSVANTLVDMYAKCGFLREAEDVFDELPMQQLVSWTALMSGYMELKLFEKALELYERIPLERLTLDSIIFVSGLKACGSLGAFDKGQMIHTDIAKEGFEEDPAISSSLVDMYAKCGCLVAAVEVLDGMLVQNVVLWTAVITGFASQGNAKTVFHMLERLAEEGIQPDVVTLLNIVTVCSHAGLVEKGLIAFDIFSQAMSSIPFVDLFNCLMDLVSRAGQLKTAFAIVEEMPYQPNLVTWNTVLGACQKWRSVKLAEVAFQCALALDWKQPAPYACMISIYADARMWEDAKRIDKLREVAWSKDPALSSVDWCFVDTF